MRVEKFTKLKNGMYKLHLEDGTDILAHEDLILKKNILLNRFIDDGDINNIDKLNNNYNAYDLAVKYISIKYRSCHEVYEYLLRHEVDKKVINDVIARLKKQKYLDDHIYTKAFVNDRIKFSSNGPYKIRKELEEKRINDSIIDEVLEVFDASLEREKLHKLIPKYVKTVRNKSYVMMKNKVVMHFSTLGYDKNIICEIVNDINYDDSLYREKEYNKLYKKYSGSELEFKIKQALYKNGYK